MTLEWLLLPKKLGTTADLNPFFLAITFFRMKVQPTAAERSTINMIKIAVTLQFSRVEVEHPSVTITPIKDIFD